MCGYFGRLPLNWTIVWNNFYSSMVFFKVKVQDENIYTILSSLGLYLIVLRCKQ